MKEKNRNECTVCGKEAETLAILPGPRAGGHRRCPACLEAYRQESQPMREGNLNRMVERARLRFEAEMRANSSLQANAILWDFLSDLAARVAELEKKPESEGSE